MYILLVFILFAGILVTFRRIWVVIVWLLRKWRKEEIGVLCLLLLDANGSFNLLDEPNNLVATT